MPCIHQYSVIQNSPTALKIPCSTSSHSSSPTPNPCKSMIFFVSIVLSLSFSIFIFIKMFSFSYYLKYQKQQLISLFYIRLTIFRIFLHPWKLERITLHMAVQFCNSASALFKHDLCSSLKSYGLLFGKKTHKKHSQNRAGRTKWKFIKLSKSETSPNQAKLLPFWNN